MSFDDFFNFNSGCQSKQTGEEDSNIKNLIEYQKNSEETTSQIRDPIPSTDASGSLSTSQENQKIQRQEEQGSQIVNLAKSSGAPLSESTESEVIAKKKSKKKNKGTQSIYKNKKKALIEQARFIIGELLNWDDDYYAKVIEEAEKDAEGWRDEINKLYHSISRLTSIEREINDVEEKIEESRRQKERRKAIKKELPKLKKQVKELERELKRACGKKEQRRLGKKIEKVHNEEDKLKEESRLLEVNKDFEEESKEAAKKELKRLKEKIKPFQARILKGLEHKRYVLFVPLFEMKENIKTFIGKKSAGFFETYKKQRSMEYFQKDMCEQELFYWTVIFKVVLVLLPKEEGTLDMTMLTKENTPLMCWLISSRAKMKVKYKDQFKELYIREYLRQDFENTFVFLKNKAAGKMSLKKLDTLNKILGVFEDVKENLSDLGESSWAQVTLDFLFEDFEFEKNFALKIEGESFDFDFGSDEELERSSKSRKMFKYN